MATRFGIATLHSRNCQSRIPDGMTNRLGGADIENVTLERASDMPSDPHTSSPSAQDAGAVARAPSSGEIRLLTAALIVLLFSLIIMLLMLATSMMRIERIEAVSDALAPELAPAVLSSSQQELAARAEFLRSRYGLARIEMYRGDSLYAEAGLRTSRTEASIHPFKGGRIIFFFESARQWRGRQVTLIAAAFATLALIAGLLILVIYARKFVRPVEQLLSEARRIQPANHAADDDAQSLVRVFRDAVRRVEIQAGEIRTLRDASVVHPTNFGQFAGTLCRSFTSGFLAVNERGDVLEINRAGREILGLPADAPLSQKTLDTLPASEFVAVVSSSHARQHAVTRQEVRLNDGSVVGVTTVPLFDDESFMGLLALFTDLTSTRGVEANVRNLEDLVDLGQLAASIAHEFRNSLFTIQGYLRLAQRPGVDATQRIRAAEAEATRLASGVDALLSFARPLQMEHSPLALRDLASAVVARFAEDNPAIEFHVEGPDVEMPADRDLLERALDNVLRNAVESIREKISAVRGRVSVTTADRPHPTIVITDNGVGLEAERAGSYLLPFRSGKSDGYGLGLALARKIVAHHGGTISLTGEPGAGATVRIEFP